MISFGKVIVFQMVFMIFVTKDKFSEIQRTQYKGLQKIFLTGDRRVGRSKRAVTLGNELEDAAIKDHLISFTCIVYP